MNRRVRERFCAKSSGPSGHDAETACRPSWLRRQGDQSDRQRSDVGICGDGAEARGDISNDAGVLAQRAEGCRSIPCLHPGECLAKTGAQSELDPSLYAQNYAREQQTPAHSSSHQQSACRSFPRDLRSASFSSRRSPVLILGKEGTTFGRFLSHPRRL